MPKFPPNGHADSYTIHYLEFQVHMLEDGFHLQMDANFQSQWELGSKLEQMLTFS